MHKNPDFVFGAQSVLETLRSDLEIERLLVLRGSKTDAMREASSVAKSLGIPVTEVPKEKLDRLTRKNHQGLLCFISAVKYYDLDGVINDCYTSGKDPFILVLDGITDVRNLGAIARTAECVGIDAIVVPKRGSAQITGDAMKTSSGALNFIKVCRIDRLSKGVRFLKDSGIKLVAATEKTDNLLFNQDLTGPLAIVMGSEETGVSDDVMKYCDAKVKIPLEGKVGSLNVGTAAAVTMYESYRQRV